MITVGQHIVLGSLVHAVDCTVPGFEGRAGEPVVLPAPKTVEEVEMLESARAAGRASGLALKEMFRA